MSNQPPSPYGQPGPPPQYGQPSQPGQPGQPGQPNQYGQPPPYGQPGHGPGGPSPATVSSAGRLPGWVVVGSAALVCLSAFLPWVTLGGESFSGIGGDDVGGAKDGVITLALGIVALLAGLGRALVKRSGGLQVTCSIVALLMGLLVALVAVIDIADVSDLGDVLDVGVGIGLWLTLVGGIVLAVGGVWALVKRR
ncbi:hypothetical protein GCM10023340_40170 [Nocardioides marinquilinus]|uniref:Integral membrane protein n=1 Tax=Nocardioides marinquilinus TaxID=1210400 RepID=A0ABP9Q282_9ACTN